MAGIDRQGTVHLSTDWGVQFSDYSINGKPFDFQDLMVAVAENRAVTVEGEVSPLTMRIKIRNSQLEALGSALAELTKVQSNFASDDKGDARSGIAISDTAYNTLSTVIGGMNFDNHKMLKREVEEWIQRCKSKIDGLNNQAQTDMTRLQSLVDRRDESYSTATNLMSAISDTRSNLIRNL